MIPQPAAPSAVVAIDDLPKLATLERHGSDFDQDGDMWACTQNAFGRIVECVGDHNGDGREDLVVGTWTGVFNESVELCGWTTIGNPPACVRIGNPISDLRIDGVAALGSGALAVASGQRTGGFCQTYGRIRVLAPGRAMNLVDSPYPRRLIGDTFAQSVARIARRDGSTLEIVVAERALVSTYSPDGTKRMGEFAHADGAPANLASIVASAPDLDGDGVTELCVAASCERTGVRIYSGATHELIAVLEGCGPSTIASAADLDGDGVGELGVGAPWAGPTQHGGLCVLTGKDLTPLFSWRGTREHETLGRSVCAQHDFDGDGTPELVVSACGGTAVLVRGAVYVISGRDGRTLLRIDGEVFERQEMWGGEMSSAERFPLTNAFGWAVATGDFDGDHVPDLAIGSPQRSGRDCIGKVYLISGVTLRERFAPRADQSR